MTMTTNKKQEMKSFWNNVFNPKGEALIDTNAYGLMAQYLKQIEEVLDEKQMTQKDLAQEIGTSASYISQFFNLNKLINLKTLAKIELALDIKFKLIPQNNYNANTINANIDMKNLTLKKALPTSDGGLIAA